MMLRLKTKEKRGPGPFKAWKSESKLPKYGMDAAKRCVSTLLETGMGCKHGQITDKPKKIWLQGLFKDPFHSLPGIRGDQDAQSDTGVCPAVTTGVSHGGLYRHRPGHLLRKNRTVGHLPAPVVPGRHCDLQQPELAADELHKPENANATGIRISHQNCREAEIGRASCRERV